MPIAPPEISHLELGFVGSGLVRPECVLVNARGDLFTADWRGGVAHLRPDGGSTLYAGRCAELDGPLRPNGIALDQDGSFLLAQLGDVAGGVFRLRTSGQLEPVLQEVDGVPLPPTNFVLLDHRHRLWVTVSTRLRPRNLGYRRDVADGFLVLIDAAGARIVADGLGYANEVQVDEAAGLVWINETFARRTSRFALRPDGGLGPRETVTEYGVGMFPDGLALDRPGHAWVTSIVSNRVVRVAPDGGQTLVLEEPDPEHVAWVEAAFVAGELGRPHLDRARQGRLGDVSSLAFGGPDLGTAFLGSLKGDSVAHFRTGIPGRPPVHWHWGPPAS